MNIKYVRELVQDTRLHVVLDQIEKFIGYRMEAVSMPAWNRPNAVASMHYNEENKCYNLWYIESEPPDQTLLCHELAHAVCWLSGAITQYNIEPYPFRLLTSMVRQSLQLFWQYMQHVPVHAFTKAMGFDESPQYNTVARGFLDRAPNLPDWRPNAEKEEHQMEDKANPHFPNMEADLRLVRTAYLTRLISLPQEEETRACLHHLGTSCCPQALEQAVAILRDGEKRLLLAPADYLAHLAAIFRITALPSGSLIASFVDKTDPNFYFRTLALASQETETPHK